MSRDEGFAVMDISTDLVNDAKFRKLARQDPELLGPAFIAYVATMAESWKAGRRVTIEDAWPAHLPFSHAAVEALAEVGLTDRGRVTLKAWKSWYEPARERRDKSRDRWARYNRHRDADQPSQPRGNDAATATSVPPVLPSVPPGPSETRESPPPPAKRGRRSDGTNPRSRGTAPRQAGTSLRDNGGSPRQERAREKRGGVDSLATILRKAAEAGRSQEPDRGAA